MTSNTPLVATLDETAQSLQLSRRTVQRMIDRGELRAIRVGAATRIAWAEIDRFVAGR